MKLWVEHDRLGTINSVCVPDAKSPFQVIPVARAGWTVSEVEARGIIGKPGSPAFLRQIRHLMKSSIVVVGEATLVKKPGKSKGQRRIR